MKIIITTSNKYLHILPIFCFLFNKNFSSNQQVEIVGYNQPDFNLPDNFTFHSLGKQEGGPENFSTDLIKYFEKQDQWFTWMMEDSFIKKVNFSKLQILHSLTYENVGRINLSKECVKQEHELAFTTYNGIEEIKVYQNTQTANYRLSTQPSIWNRDFLLKYLTPGLTPWKFETQESINDGWKILGLDTTVVEYNEGVRKHDLYKYDLNGVSDDQIEEMKKLNIL